MAVILQSVNAGIGQGFWFLHRYVIGRVLKGHICQAFQIASHMQVNPSIHEVSLLMSHAITGNSSG